MDISDLKKKKKEAGMTNHEIAVLSGIPISTVNKIFSGATKNPRYGTLLAIEQVLASREAVPFTYNVLKEEPVLIRDRSTPYCYTARAYGGEDIEKLSEGTPAELIDGKLYMLSAPNTKHQCISGRMFYMVMDYIFKRKGKCQVYAAPFDVRLFADDRTVVQPDISVICDPDKLTERGCSGAPDWVVEIVSESNSSHDYVRKLMKYQKAGVREYWIVDPYQEFISVYNFEDPQRTAQYMWEETVPSGVLEGLNINMKQLLER